MELWKLQRVFRATENTRRRKCATHRFREPLQRCLPGGWEGACGRRGQTSASQKTRGSRLNRTSNVLKRAAEDPRGKAFLVWISSVSHRLKIQNWHQSSENLEWSQKTCQKMSHRFFSLSPYLSVLQRETWSCPSSISQTYLLSCCSAWIEYWPLSHPCFWLFFLVWILN